MKKKALVFVYRDNVSTLVLWQKAFLLTPIWGIAARGPDATPADAATGNAVLLGACVFAARDGGMVRSLACSCARPAICARNFTTGHRAGEAEAQTGDQARGG